MHCTPNGHRRVISVGSASAGELIEILSTERKNLAASSIDRIPPATQNGMSITINARHPAFIDYAAIAGGGNVIEHQFVRAFVGIAFGQRKPISPRPWLRNCTPSPPDHHEHPDTELYVCQHWTASLTVNFPLTARARHHAAHAGTRRRQYHRYRQYRRRIEARSADIWRILLRTATLEPASVPSREIRTQYMLFRPTEIGLHRSFRLARETPDFSASR